MLLHLIPHKYKNTVAGFDRQTGVGVLQILAETTKADTSAKQ